MSHTVTWWLNAYHGRLKLQKSEGPRDSDCQKWFVITIFGKLSFQSGTLMSHIDVAHLYKMWCDENRVLCILVVYKFCDDFFVCIRVFLSFISHSRTTHKCALFIFPIISFLLSLPCVYQRMHSSAVTAAIHSAALPAARDWRLPWFIPL